jgi:DNA-binding CsgD family transcriptional regulator
MKGQDMSRSTSPGRQHDQSRLAIGVTRSSRAGLGDGKDKNVSRQGRLEERTSHSEVPFLTREQWISITTALRLSPREATIAAFILGGSDESMIAASLVISPHTVRSYLERLYRKVSVHSRCELAVRLFETHVKCANSPPSSADQPSLPISDRQINN